MRTVSTASQLEIDRIQLGNDHQFVMRCQDGAYGQFVSEVAIDVVCRETVEGHEPTDSALADAVIDEIRQTAQDAALPLAA